MMSGKSLKKPGALSEETDNISFKTFAEDVLVGICLVQDNRFVYANPRFVELAGRSADELGRREIVYEMLFHDEREKVINGMDKVLSGNADSFLDQFRVLRGDGTIKDVECSFSLTNHSGRPALIGTAVDITEKKRLEAQKTDFLAMVSHDFKTPLTTVMGYADLIASNETLSKDILEQVESIRRGGRKLLDMVEDFLLHAQVESGHITPEFMPVDVCSLFNEIRNQFSVQAARMSQTIETKCEKDMPPLLLDRRLIERALSNLVQNAINHTYEGGKIIISAGYDGEGRNDSVNIRVSDNGCGIPQEFRSRIFDTYFRLSVSPGTRGAGLGLTIVRTVAEAHGGSVTLDSREGKGSVFTIKLPVRRT